MSFRPSTILLVPFGIVAILGACSDSSSSNAPPPAADVLIVAGAMSKGFQAYNPDTLTISIANGGKVIWRNDDAVTHTVTDTTAAAAFSRTLGAGDTASVVFGATGEFPFKCSIHPTMRGLIVVTS
jgi:plastocyanin